MDQNLPLISIQVLNWNRAEETVRSIHSALEQTYPNIEIVIVDNGSTDHSIALISSTFPEIKIIQLDKNYGCPDGRNRGIDHCNGEFIFYLDNDGVLHREAVKRAHDTIKDDKDIAIVTGQVYDFDYPNEIDPSIQPRSNKKYEFANFQGGICMHRKSIYEKIGRYPKHFFYGGEEWYLTCKVIDNNWKIIKNESIILWHKRSLVARDRTAELLNQYYNKLYVCISLYPIKYAILFMFYFPPKYLMYAKEEGIQKKFRRTLFNRYFKTVVKAFKDRKDPIKTSTYNKLNIGH